MLRFHKHTARGATILEAVCAGTLMAFFLGAMFELNGRNMQLLKTGKESFAATLVLEERLEQVRCGTWPEITSAEYLQTILSTPPSSGSQLPALREQITVSAYPAPTAPATPSPNTVTRDGAGLPIVRARNLDMPKEDLVRVDLQVRWEGTPGRRPRTREISTVIADRGLITR